MAFVLVVEADGLASFEVSEEFRGHFEVLIAANLHEAFAHIDAAEAEICAVISDVLVPSAAGVFQPPRRIWERVLGTARIILSEERAEATQSMTGVTTLAEAHAVVHRPWLPGDLLAAVLRAIRLLAEPVAPGA